MLKDYIQARNFLRLNENSGRPPLTKVYRDHLGIPTISTGFNLRREDARSWIEGVGADFDKILSGEAELTVKQAETIEEKIINESETILKRKLGASIFDKLNANRQAALVSLCLVPKLIGPNLTKYIQNSQFKDAENEIRHNSNHDHHPGLQARREREADLFAKS